MSPPLAAAIAGLVAGTLATFAQMALWAVAGHPVWETLLRDARFAAAIVLGVRVLPPPNHFDWTVMLVASAIHFALSIVYGLAFASAVRPRHAVTAVAIGGASGVAIYGVNMYAFTVLFPWFAASRDWITLAAHVAFGVTLGAGCAALGGGWRPRR